MSCFITDKNNNVIKTVEDAASIQKYGLVQRVLKQNDGEDATTQAKKMLVTVESSATVSGVPNDFRAVSGYSIIVQETDTGLYGQFYIESDTHTFSCGKAQYSEITAPRLCISIYCSICSRG